MSVRSWCEMEDGGVGGCGEARIREVDLLVTITIELLYKAPVDNIGGITEQERQSSFIKKKKSLVGVERRQRLRPCWDDLCEHSLSGLEGVQSVSPAASLRFY